MTRWRPRAVVVNRSFVAKYLDDVPIERRSVCRSAPDAVRDCRSGKRDALDRRRGRRPEAGRGRTRRRSRRCSSPTRSCPARVMARRPSWCCGRPTIRRAHVEALRTAIREEDPSLALDAVMTMDAADRRVAGASAALCGAVRGLRGLRAGHRRRRVVRRAVALGVAAVARAGGAHGARRQPRGGDRRRVEADERRDRSPAWQSAWRCRRDSRIS